MLMKRVFDLVLAVPLGILALPVILAAAVWVKLTSPGPAFFSQERLGRCEKRFLCHKLRTMHHGTTSMPTHEVAPETVTPEGRLLRALKLDELPQLWNVITGEMSLVGPRPCLPGQQAMIERRRARGVFALLPGITGLAQSRGIDMSDPEKCVEADAEYLRTHSTWTDLKILVMTLWPGSRI